MQMTSELHTGQPWQKWWRPNVYRRVLPKFHMRLKLIELGAGRGERGYPRLIIVSFHNRTDQNRPMANICRVRHSYRIDGTPCLDLTAI
jgi:hypothetical protein